MFNEAKVTELRNTAKTQLESLLTQKKQIDSAMADLQDQANLKQRELNTVVQHIIETNASLASLTAILEGASA